jgi:hypothetical protein
MSEGSIVRDTVGRQRPRSNRPADIEAPNSGPCALRSAKAASGVVKRPDPRSNRGEPRLYAVPTRRKPRQRHRERTRCGCTQSFHGWQKSIERIMWVACRVVKSRVADAKASKSLAGRKPEAPSDAGHGSRKGEAVRGAASSIKRSRNVPASGFRPVGLRDDGRRPRTRAHGALTGGVERMS